MSVPSNSPVTLRSFSLSLPVPHGFHPGIGGMYATGKPGLGRQIEVAAQTPPYFGTQTWTISDPDIHGLRTIRYQTDKGWATANDLAITLGLESRYRVEYQGNTTAADPVVTVRPSIKLVGRNYYVGASKDNKLEVTGIPFGLGAPAHPIVPVWIIRRAN